MQLEENKLYEEPIECYCRRCHRKLTNPKYIELGMGPICYEKAKNRRRSKPLFEMKKVQTNELSEIITKSE